MIRSCSQWSGMRRIWTSRGRKSIKVMSGMAGLLRPSFARRDVLTRCHRPIRASRLERSCTSQCACNLRWTQGLAEMIDHCGPERVAGDKLAMEARLDDQHTFPAVGGNARYPPAILLLPRPATSSRDSTIAACESGPHETPGRSPPDSCPTATVSQSMPVPATQDVCSLSA
jgi:hypothetical protein